MQLSTKNIKMKKLFILPVVLMLTAIMPGYAIIQKGNGLVTVRLVTEDLSVYAGKFQMKRDGKDFYLSIEVVDGDLIATSLWDHQKMNLKHLSGDKFIVSGLDWSVKFIRDKDNKVTKVLVMGTDLWTRVDV